MLSAEALEEILEKRASIRYARQKKRWNKKPDLYDYLKDNPLFDIKEQVNLKGIKAGHPYKYLTKDEVEMLIYASC